MTILSSLKLLLGYRPQQRFSQPFHYGCALAAVVACYMFRGHSDLLRLLHLGSFSVSLGIQCWVSFVAGVVMFQTLPRHLFGQLQGRLFPLYFLLGSFLSGIACITLWLRGSGEVGVSLYLLGASCAANILNGIVWTPWSIHVYEKRNRVERELGTGDQVGQLSPKLDNEEHRRLQRQFLLLHGASSLTNMASLVCNTVYLYFLAEKFQL